MFARRAFAPPKRLPRPPHARITRRSNRRSTTQQHARTVAPQGRRADVPIGCAQLRESKARRGAKKRGKCGLGKTGSESGKSNKPAKSRPPSYRQNKRRRPESAFSLRRLLLGTSASRDSRPAFAPSSASERSMSLQTHAYITARLKALPARRPSPRPPGTHDGGKRRETSRTNDPGSNGCPGRRESRRRSFTPARVFLAGERREGEAARRKTRSREEGCWRNAGAAGSGEKLLG